MIPSFPSLHFLTKVKSSSYFPMAAWIFLRTSSLVTWSLYEMFSNLHLISKACVLISSSAVKFHYSQAYRNMDMTRECISFTFDPRDMMLYLHIGFSFVRAAVACAILERTSGFERSSQMIAPRYLKFVTVQNLSDLILISFWIPLALFVISIVFSALISISYRVQVGWLVVWGLTALLRQYFSLYRAVSQSGGERGEKRQTRVKLSKQPPPVPTASTIGPCPTVIQIVGRPALEDYPEPLHTRVQVLSRL